MSVAASPMRSARKEGRQVVSLERVEADGEVVIECEVWPVGALRVEPLRPGPYRFASKREADAFLAEAAQALTFLGCDVS